jgi:hypothetical protein
MVILKQWEVRRPVSLETIKKYYRIDRREICFLRFIFEAYDGIAVLRTLDPEQGAVVLHVSPGCEKDVEMILQDLKRNIMIEPMSPEKGAGWED